VLIDAVRAVSQGRTPNLPKIPQADIRDLAESLDEMIHKLEEQKTMEEKLKRAEQEAMLAQLASGIAHEIRNPLNFISLSIDHLATLDLLKTAEGEAGPGDLLRKMKAEVRRINQMVTNFLDLGRELVLHPIQLRVDLPVEEALGLNSQLIQDRGISVQRNYPAKAPLVKIDIDKMKSCFQNLIINAADSMPTGGTLSIRIEEGDGSVRLVFEDTGTGIRPEHLSQVFEPYFTTKNTGTGLGLAITKRIVEAHAGKIDIASTPGQGTRVEISIPHAG
jgi:signal transduction histidine kinase